MRVDVRVDGLDAVKARLRGLSEKKIKVAAVAALNDAAYAGYQATRQEMQKVFDRPTSWVLGGVRYVKARTDRLESQVDFDKWGNKTNVTVEKVLAAEIQGGLRKHKRHESALQQAGILPSGMAIVPGPGAQLDQNGNMSAAQIVQIVSWFKAFGEQGYRANMRDGGKRLGKDNRRTGQKGFAYFALQKPHGKLQPGIYQRFSFGVGTSVRPVMFFVRTPFYKSRLDFYGVAQKSAMAAFEKAFPRYLNQLLAERGL